MFAIIIECKITKILVRARAHSREKCGKIDTFIANAVLKV